MVREKVWLEVFDFEPNFSHTISYPISFYSHLPAYEDGTECYETSEYKIQTPGNYPKESVQQIMRSLKTVFL